MESKTLRDETVTIFYPGTPLKNLRSCQQGYDINKLSKKKWVVFQLPKKKNVIFIVLKLFLNLYKFHILALCVWSQKDTSTFFQCLIIFVLCYTMNVILISVQVWGSKMGYLIFNLLSIHSASNSTDTSYRCQCNKTLNVLS